MNKLKMIRGFEIVRDEKRIHKNEAIDLPIRGDKRSAGYDIKIPVDVILEPKSKKLVFTDIKAYMQDDEVLELHVRSSIGVKKGIILANVTGIVDSSYYNNPDNDGNLGFCLFNTSDQTVILKAGERVCQGIFKKYLTIDNDQFINENRVGGFGSSGKR